MRSEDQVYQDCLISLYCTTQAGYSSEELPTSDHGVVPLFRICPTGLDPNAGK